VYDSDELDTANPMVSTPRANQTTQKKRKKEKPAYTPTVVPKKVVWVPKQFWGHPFCDDCEGEGEERSTGIISVS